MVVDFFVQLPYFKVNILNKADATITSPDRWYNETVADLAPRIKVEEN